jgi:hypothetical protein
MNPSPIFSGAGLFSIEDESRRHRLFLFLAVFLPILLDNLLRNILGGNEMDVLCGAKQFLDHAWLPTDWYLNLDIGYRRPFFLIAGSLARILPLPAVSIVGRVLTWLLLAWGISRIGRSLKIPAVLLCVAAFAFSRWQSLTAGEWMVQGFDTKSFAYAFVILGLDSLLRRQPLRTFLFCGLSVSFHVLIGSFGCAAVFAAALFDRSWTRESVRTFLKALWIFPVAAASGIVSALQFLKPVPGGREADLIYVLLRVPHHVFPSEWGGPKGIILFVLIVIALGFFLALSRDRVRRMTAAFGLAGGAFFATGLLLYATGHFAQLKFYWFRFADTVFPLLVILFTLSCAAPLLDAKRNPRIGPSVRTAAVLLALVCLVMSSGQFVKGAVRIVKHPSDFWLLDLPPDLRDILGRISRELPRDALVLAPPTIDKFHLAAGRPVYVTFKESPQSQSDILEWKRRLVLCNGGNEFLSQGFKAERELDRGYGRLGGEALAGFRDAEGVRYWLARRTARPGFREVLTNRTWAVYDLGSALR